jgi:hypothetical protein
MIQDSLADVTVLSAACSRMVGWLVGSAWVSASPSSVMVSSCFYFEESDCAQICIQVKLVKTALLASLYFY